MNYTFERNIILFFTPLLLSDNWSYFEESKTKHKTLKIINKNKKFLKERDIGCIKYTIHCSEVQIQNKQKGSSLLEKSRGRRYSQ